jgi:[acyl-carrier-protein] S-malonyltransferase
VRAERGAVALSALDDAPTFGAAHMAGDNAAALIFAATARDALRLDPDKVDVVAVLGNSMGWYTSLYIGGVFDFENGFRLADRMGAMQNAGVVGGQLLYPVVDDLWRADDGRKKAVEEALAAARLKGRAVGPSIRLGGLAVLWGDVDGVRELLGALPKVRFGERDYPFQLHGHSAFHSPLLKSVAERALAESADLPWRAPRTTLIDGRGHAFRPLTTDPAALYRYTLSTQIVETYDFTASVRVCLREFAPDSLVLLGPGDSLGGAIAQAMIEERRSGLASKTDFLARQATDPLLISLERSEQAALVV